MVLLPINPGSQRATLGSFDSLILRQTNGLKREMKMLETVELQILGALLKIKGARCNEGQTDIETVARKCKASFKSIKIKLEVLEKELNDLNHLKEKNQQLIKQNEKLWADLTNSQSLLENCLGDFFMIESTGKDLELQYHDFIS